VIEDGIDDVPPTATERRSCGYGFRKRAYLVHKSTNGLRTRQYD
jgi:hypothetical protein